MAQKQLVNAEYSMLTAECNCEEHVRYRVNILIGVFILTAICSAANGSAQGATSGEQFVGVWSGRGR